MKINDLGDRKFEFVQEGNVYPFECDHSCVYHREFMITPESPLGELIAEDQFIFTYIQNWLDEHGYIVPEEEWVENSIQLFLNEIKILPRKERRRRIREYEREHNMVLERVIPLRN